MFKYCCCYEYVFMSLKKLWPLFMLTLNHNSTVDYMNSLTLENQNPPTANQLTLNHNQLVPCFLWKIELWTRPFDWASVTNRLAHAFHLMSCFLMFLYAMYQLIVTCYNSCFSPHAFHLMYCFLMFLYAMYHQMWEFNIESS